MKYQFRCKNHGVFMIEQSIFADHVAKCRCGLEGQRIYSRLSWIWAGEAYRSDGSRREANDYAILKG